MDEMTLVLIPLLPLMLAILMALRWSASLLVIAPSTALLAAWMLPIGSVVDLPWLLLGLHWALDATGRLFLLFSALIWLAASLYVMQATQGPMSQRHYRVLFLLALSGNLLLIVAADMVSFYLGFALMGLSAYGLLLGRSQRSRRAARVYLVFTLAGELALFSALMLMYQASGSLLFAAIQVEQIPSAAVALLLLGFGIKLALPGLHPWLPLAYSAAPLVSVAVLSGPMMKAGLLGWLRFLPSGSDAWQFWSDLLLWLGGAGIVLGTLLALVQKLPSAVLAYSSIVKMGLVSAMFGFALARPQWYDAIVAALVLFAMHHLVVKSMLFLGVHELQQSAFARWRRWGVALLAASLMGLPLSGALAAKLTLKDAVSGELMLILGLAGVAGVLIMLHFIACIQSRATSSAAPAPAQKIAGLVWWALLPVAWLAPFWPQQLVLYIDSLVLPALCAVIYYSASKWLILEGRRPHWIRPGDIHHLLRGVRLTSPLRLRSERVADAPPGSRVIAVRNAFANETSSLLQPGLAWLMVSVLLLLSLTWPLLVD